MMKKSSILMRGFVCAAAGVFLFVFMIGCSALSTGVSGSPALKGVFMDGPVGGLNYSTPTLKGVTKADGIFEYKAGETVTFSLGGLELGSATGKPVITPLDIVKDAKGANDQRVVNICVLLQTLDQDGNADNGIMISEKAAVFVGQYGKNINFDKSVRAFSFDGGFRSVMAELNNIDFFGDVPRAVKPPKVAQKHLQASLAELQKKAEPAKK